MFCQFKVMFQCCPGRAMTNTIGAPNALTLPNGQTAGPHQLHGCFSLADLSVNSWVWNCQHSLCCSTDTRSVTQTELPQRANIILVVFLTGTSRHAQCKARRRKPEDGTELLKMQTNERCHWTNLCSGRGEMKNNVELSMSGCLDVHLVLVIGPSSQHDSMNALLTVML